MRRKNENSVKRKESKMSKRSTGKMRHNEKGTEKPVVIIGKNGPTDRLVKEIHKNLDHSKVVKVKILKSALINVSTEEIARKVSDATNARIVEIRGHTFVLYKPKKNRKGIYNTPLKYSEER